MYMFVLGGQKSLKTYLIFTGEKNFILTFFLDLEGNLESLSRISFMTLKVFDSAFVSTVS